MMVGGQRLLRHSTSSSQQSGAAKCSLGLKIALFLASRRKSRRPTPADARVTRGRAASFRRVAVTHLGRVSPVHVGRTASSNTSRKAVFGPAFSRARPRPDDGRRLAPLRRHVAVASQRPSLTRDYLCASRRRRASRRAVGTLSLTRGGLSGGSKMTHAKSSPGF